MKKKDQKIKRRLRVRRKINGTSERPRLSVYRSSRYVYAQLIDDESRKTIIGVSEKHLANAGPVNGAEVGTQNVFGSQLKSVTKASSASANTKNFGASPRQSHTTRATPRPVVVGKISKARDLGLLLAQKAKKKGITQVVFDRGANLYHGRIKALSEGAREGGLKF